MLLPRPCFEATWIDSSLEYNAGNNTTEEVLRLPEMIARSKGCHIVVCIDEFQQIGDFPDSLTFQKKLRSVWQLQSHVSYCLYGSKKHMMEQMFQNASYPFYRFGDFFYLNKNEETSGCILLGFCINWQSIFP